MRPLDGIRVVDLTHVLAGPYCAYQLALLGADVVKVEPPGGDMVRMYEGTREQILKGLGAGFVAQNAGKKSLCLDVKRAEGREIVLDLAERADVFLENYRPGALEKYGLGFEHVKSRNERIVYASITAFGQNGPHGHRPGFDDVVQATSGFMSSNSREGQPIRTGGAVLDYATGMHATAAILAGLRLRDRTSEAQRIDLAMQDVTMLLNNYQTARTSRTGASPKPSGDIVAPMLGRFPAREGWVMLAGYLPRHCQSIARALGLDQLAEVSFKDLLTNGAEIQATVAARLLEKTAMEWDEIFDRLGVVAGAVRDPAEAFGTGQPGARELTAPIEGSADETHYTANGYRVNDQVWGPRFGVSRLGEDSREVLRSMGLNDDQIGSLIDQGIVAETQPDPQGS